MVVIVKLIVDKCMSHECWKKAYTTHEAETKKGNCHTCKPAWFSFSDALNYIRPYCFSPVDIRQAMLTTPNSATSKRARSHCHWLRFYAATDILMALSPATQIKLTMVQVVRYLPSVLQWMFKNSLRLGKLVERALVQAELLTTATVDSQCPVGVGLIFFFLVL